MAAPPAPPGTHALPELAELAALVAAGGPYVQQRLLCEVEADGATLPVHAVLLGNPHPDMPAVGFFGGVHGLERIGSEVVIAHLRSLVMRLAWDELLHRQLEVLRLVFVAVVNPGGLSRGTRANPNGVDLMRNAPVQAAAGAAPLLGGQRISRRLPWYRGALGADMQPEASAVCRVVREELLTRPFSVAIDCHSGFGLADRIWFPYAHTAEPMEHLAELHALEDLFDRAHPQHRYVVEPQSRQYLTHGDLWDHLHLEACRSPDRIFLPLTLEMGSWTWIKKNPRQLFSRQGIFNPLIEHRRRRVLRRHLPWLGFVGHAAASYGRWLPVGAERESHRRRALARWYGQRP